MKEGLKFVLTMPGELCVTQDGMQLMQMLCAINLAFCL